MTIPPNASRTTGGYASFGGTRTYGTPRHPHGHTLKTIGLTTRNLEDLRRD